MDAIYCNNCGAELDEAPTLLPDQRPPCPRCSSLARRFEKTLTGSVTIARAQPATLTVTAHDASLSAGVAEGVGEALPPTVKAGPAGGRLRRPSSAGNTPTERLAARPVGAHEREIDTCQPVAETLVSCW
jgi:hypothetical protein